MDYIDLQSFAKYLKGFLYGLYSGIFALYLHYYASKKDASKGNDILFYALCLLYVLSVATIILDLCGFFLNLSLIPMYHLDIIQATVFACCDFIAQLVLIYRCWIVWGRNIRVVIVPSILAFAFLAIWIAGGTAIVMVIPGQDFVYAWGSTLTVTGLAVSLTVNALVMGLIVFRIFKVLQEVKPTSNERILGAGGSTLRPVIFILIESGMILFSIQLVRLVLLGLAPSWTESDGNLDNVSPFIVVIHQMLNGITPTVILVRVSMGFSFYDENSMVEASTGSLRFAPANNHNPTLSETESTSIIDQEM